MVSFQPAGAAGGQVASEDAWPKGLDSSDCRGVTIAAGSRERLVITRRSRGKTMCAITPLDRRLWGSSKTARIATVHLVRRSVIISVPQHPATRLSMT